MSDDPIPQPLAPPATPPPSAPPGAPPAGVPEAPAGDGFAVATAADAPPGTKVIRDPWPWARPVTLDGALERGSGLHPAAAAILAFFGGYLLYAIGSAVLLVIYLAVDAAQSGAPLDPATLQAQMIERADALLGANAIAQAIGFGLFTLFVTRLSTKKQKAAFLRFRRIDPAHLMLSCVGWVAVAPLVQWLGGLNRSLPIPETWVESDQMMGELIEQVLGNSTLGVGYLLAVIALTPAIFEEVFFRGYLQRQVERGWGVAASIGVVALIFGAMHLQPTNFLPLAGLGVYLGFVVWVTGSLWAGVAVHLLNNGAAVLLMSYLAENPQPELESLEAVGVPFWAALLSLAATVALCELMRRRRLGILGAAPAYAP